MSPAEQLAVVLARVRLRIRDDRQRALMPPATRRTASPAAMRSTA